MKCKILMDLVNLSGKKRPISPTFLLDSEDWDDDKLSQSLLNPTKRMKNIQCPKPKTDCTACQNNEDTDNSRNQLFTQLLCEELNHLKPCLRTKIYAKILIFINNAKGCHTNEISLDSQEKN